MENNIQLATFANGCFWCTEAVFKRLKGIASVTSGYTGGKRENPSYDQVSTGATGHAEAIQVTFDPNVISYDKLLGVFFLQPMIRQHLIDRALISERNTALRFFITQRSKKGRQKKRYKLLLIRVRITIPLSPRLFPLKNSIKQRGITKTIMMPTVLIPTAG